MRSCYRPEEFETLVPSLLDCFDLLHCKHEESVFLGVNSPRFFLIRNNGIIVFPNVVSWTKGEKSAWKMALLRG